MRLVILALIALNLSACASKQYKWEWDLNLNDQAGLAKARAVEAECKDFAYRSKVAGSRYTELDIHISCMQRKGYKLKQVEVANGR